MGVVNHAVEQNAAGTAAYEKALELAEEIMPNVSCNSRLLKMCVFVSLRLQISFHLLFEVCMTG